MALLGGITASIQNAQLIPVAATNSLIETQSSALRKLKKKVSITRSCQKSRLRFLFEPQNLVYAATRLNEFT